jgi:hypothetical protein
MDRESILKMEPGREMDVLVAEKVLGYEVGGDIIESPFPEDMPGDFLFIETAPHRKPLKKYSTDIAAAWEVAEKFNDGIKLESWDGYTVEICYPKCIKVHARTAPEAICKAALLTILWRDRHV